MSGYRTSELIDDLYPELSDYFVKNRSLVNRLAEEISELQWCGSCAGCTPESDHCLSCTIEAIETLTDQSL